MSQDRRTTPRADTLFRVEPLDGSPNLYAQDISLGGLYVTSARPRWPGELLPVRFTLPDSDRAIRVTCRVVSLDDAPAGCGLCLRFLRLSAEASLAIHDYIDARPIVARDDTLRARVQAWIDRINDDCSELLTLARS